MQYALNERDELAHAAPDGLGNRPVAVPDSLGESTDRPSIGPLASGPPRLAIRQLLMASAISLEVRAGEARTKHAAGTEHFAHKGDKHHRPPYSARRLAIDELE